MSAWLTQARRKDVKIFLGIWIFSMTLPYIQMLAPALGYEAITAIWVFWVFAIGIRTVCFITFPDSWDTWCWRIT